MIKLLFLLAFSLNAESPADSIGIETINGKTFVIHKVENKETLFAISRRYRTTVDAILQHNASAGSGLEVGQILKVPYTRPVNKPSRDGIVHKVAPKETLYSISRTYGVTMEDIRAWNGLADNALAIGQELVIRKSSSSLPSRPQPVQHETPLPISRKGVHTVQQGQTLFSIARQYEVSVDDLKTWNNLQSNELSIGQTLFVAAPERNAVARSQERNEAARPEERNVTVRSEEAKQSTPAPQAQTRREPVTTAETPAPVRSAPSSKTTAPSSPSGQSAESIRISESLKNGDEIVEGGLAELIEGTEGNRKYLALHRTAPMGTILKVRNEMNNREVFVRVMGKLPDTAMTDKLIIKISKSAYDRLGAIDPRFRVEVTYYK